MGTRCHRACPCGGRGVLERKFSASENHLVIVYVLAHFVAFSRPAVSLPQTISDPPSANAQDSARWFAEEVHAHDASLKAYLRHAYPAVRDPEDVVQESYLRVWKTRSAHPIRSAKAFLFTVARRLALDVLRRERRSPVESVGELPALGVLDDGPAVPDVVNQQEKVELLIAAIDVLPARCREVVILHKLRLLPAREVAERLGISEKGGEIQVKRGLDRVRAYLRRRGIISLLGRES